MDIKSIVNTACTNANINIDNYNILIKDYCIKITQRSSLKLANVVLLTEINSIIYDYKQYNNLFAPEIWQLFCQSLDTYIISQSIDASTEAALIQTAPAHYEIIQNKFRTHEDNIKKGDFIIDNYLTIAGNISPVNISRQPPQFIDLDSYEIAIKTEIYKSV
jgi:hypothetical protein